MALMTADEYKAKLDDGRVVFCKGERVKNVATDPNLSACVNTMAVDYEMAHDPKSKDLALVDDPELGEPVSRYYHKPKDEPEDLLKAHELIVTSTAIGDGYIPLAHDIGADALNAISITAHMMGNQDYIDRPKTSDNNETEDIATCAGVTCVKGDRMLRPSDPGQLHPDYYVRVVDKNGKGIVVGAPRFTLPEQPIARRSSQFRAGR